MMKELGVKKDAEKSQVAGERMDGLIARGVKLAGEKSDWLRRWDGHFHKDACDDRLLPD
jgi:hypothetical protein